MPNHFRLIRTKFYGIILPNKIFGGKRKCLRSSFIGKQTRVFCNQDLWNVLFISQVYSAPNKEAYYKVVSFRGKRNIDDFLHLRRIIPGNFSRSICKK